MDPAGLHPARPPGHAARHARARADQQEGDEERAEHEEPRARAAPGAVAERVDAEDLRDDRHRTAFTRKPDEPLVNVAVAVLSFHGFGSRPDGRARKRANDFVLAAQVGAPEPVRVIV